MPRNPDVVPAIELRINGYPVHQNIQTLQVYRATNGLDARSVRSMKKLPEIDVAATRMAVDTVWLIRDDFSDLGYVPYNDPLFYVLSVSRTVEYQDRDGVLDTVLVPSDPSKTVLTNIVENYNPNPPKLEYYSTPANGNGELEQVTLAWLKETHNGKYHLYQQNSEGDWIVINVVQGNSDRILVPLVSTSLGSGTLQVQDGDSNPLYHHFKVVSENFAGMTSRKEESSPSISLGYGRISLLCDEVPETSNSRYLCDGIIGRKTINAVGDPLAMVSGRGFVKING